MKGGKIAADTSFILSLLIERAQTPRAVEALRWAQEQYHEIYLPRQVIAEVVYVLEGIHKHTRDRRRLSRWEIKEIVLAIMNTSRFVVEQEQEVKEALAFYQRGVSFGDALIAAHLLSRGIKDVLSFDQHFRRLGDFAVYPEREDA